MSIPNDVFDVGERPRSMRSINIAPDIDCVSAALYCGDSAFLIRNADGQLQRSFPLVFDDVLIFNNWHLRFFDRMAEKARLSRSVPSDIVRRDLSERGAGTEIADSAFVKRPPIILVDPIARRVGQIGVDGLSIKADDAEHKIRRPHAALDFERENARLNELRDMAVHTHVLYREFVSAFPVFIQYFARFLVNKPIRPAAGLQTKAAVAALAEKHAGVNALPALRDTHITVHEIFDFETSPFFKQRKLLQ